MTDTSSRCRKQQHDDAHYPMQGKGKRGTRPKSRLWVSLKQYRVCNNCETVGPLGNDHFCDQPSERGGSWREFKIENSRQATEAEVYGV